MKQKDITVIVVVAFISAIFSYMISNKLFVTPQNRQQTAEVVDVIETKFTPTDKRFFNSESINPALDTQLGGNNQNPFNGASQ